MLGPTSILGRDSPKQRITPASIFSRRWLGVSSSEIFASETHFVVWRRLPSLKMFVHRE